MSSKLFTKEKSHQAQNRDGNRRRKFSPCGACGRQITLKIDTKTRFNTIFTGSKVIERFYRTKQNQFQQKSAQ